MHLGLHGVIYLIGFILISHVCGEIYIHREYENDASFVDWVQSEKKPETAGILELKSLKLESDSTKKSLYTAQPGKFYHYSLSLSKPFNTTEKDLAFQFALTHEDGIGCGGGYLKLLMDNDAKNFDGDTQYAIMFGPDICGSNGRIHLIFNIDGKNILKTDDIPYTADKLTHIYTLVVWANKTYDVLVDCKSVDSGLIKGNWDFESPKEIDDSNDKKPEDWVETPTIDDPNDTKPDGWDQPEFINDPSAVKPVEWDDETDGEFIPNKIPNPDFKGAWKPKQIPNPKYKGEWKPKKIANPDYKEITSYSEYSSIQAVGYDIWAVDGHSHLSHVMLSDEPDLVSKECNDILPSFMEYNNKVKEAEEKKQKEQQPKEAEQDMNIDKELSENDPSDDTTTTEEEIVGGNKDEL